MIAWKNSLDTIAPVDRNIGLRVAFDGTDFHGWQNQPGQRTVQGVLEEAIRRSVRHPVELIGSGRTDAGVHAVGHVSNFRTTIELPLDKLLHSIVSGLPEDLAISEIREVRSDFHATQSALAKWYRYRIHNAESRPVERFTQRYVYHYWRPLDADRMREGARHFVGTHDFSAMAAAGCDRQTMVRTVFRCDIERELDEIRIDVEGDGFLYKQVRNMVGTLINVGRGHWSPELVADILASRDRAQAGPTAPPRGLCLQWVRYPPETLIPDSTPAAPRDHESLE